MTLYFNEKKPSELCSRLYIVTALALFAFFVLGARLWYLQVMEGRAFKELSSNNRIRLVKKTAPRGLIFDRSGVRLAENHPGFDLSIIAEDLTDRIGTINKLSALVGIDRETIEARLKKAEGRPPFQPVKIKENLSWEEMVGVEIFKFKLPGVVLEEGPKRNYPFSEATAHIIGYIGEINERKYKELKNKGLKNYSLNSTIGKYGVEASTDHSLRGIDGGRHIEVDALGREIKTLKKFHPKPGNDIYLTIDIVTQLAAARAMEGKAGAVVALEPRSGKIIALVSSPSFDPNKLSTGVSQKEWREIVSNPLNVLTNRTIQGQYPPASTFKVITASAALEEEVISSSTKIYAGPSFKLGRQIFRDWKEAGHGKIAVHRAIVESADTFFYQVGLKVGIEALAYYANGFGLGKKTGIDLDNEKPGLVPTSEWKRKVYNKPWYRGETVNTSVGQGYMLATPLQLVSAYAAIANGGTLYEPKLIELIKSPGGETLVEFKPVVMDTVPVSYENLRIIRKALKGVVDETGGTAAGLRTRDLQIAGKTGTAQVVRLKKREKDIEKIPYKLRDHAWFVGFAPYNEPRIVVAVLVEHGGFGSKAAAPVALEVFKAYLNNNPDPQGAVHETSITEEP